MKNTFGLPIIGALLMILGACTHSAHRHHATPLPDPKGFNAHFGDIDRDGNGAVNWEEFKTHFKNATPEVFSAVDLDADRTIRHDEWHAFKQAHGMRHP